MANGQVHSSNWSTTWECCERKPGRQFPSTKIIVSSGPALRTGIYSLNSSTRLLWERSNIPSNGLFQSSVLTVFRSWQEAEAKARSLKSILPSGPVPSSRNALHSPLMNSEELWSSDIPSPAHDNADVSALTIMKPLGLIPFYFWDKHPIREQPRRILPHDTSCRNVITEHVCGDERKFVLGFPLLSDTQWSCLRWRVWFQDLILYFSISSHKFMSIKRKFFMLLHLDKCTRLIFSSTYLKT